MRSQRGPLLALALAALVPAASVAQRPDPGTLAAPAPGGAERSTVYAAVLSTKVFVVGAANAPTGLFYQHPSDDTTWQHTGPVNIRQFGAAIDPRSGGRTLYICAGNGVHRSTDGGATWKVTTGWRITEVLWVTADPRNSEVVYCATPYGIFKSSDGCKTWAEASRGLNAKFTQCVIVDRTNSATLYCAAEDGAYVSHDGAATWERMGLSVGGIRIIAQHPSDPAMLVAGTEDYGIYISRNGGRWWTRSEAGVDHTTFYAVTFDPNNPDILYAAGYVTGVYKSVDKGRSWTRMNEGLKPLSIHSLAVDPTNSNRVYAATFWHGVYRTDNGGGLWRSAGLEGSEVWHIFIEPH